MIPTDRTASPEGSALACPLTNQPYPRLVD
jgi:hypothetical protein